MYPCGIVPLVDTPPWPDYGPYSQITPLARGGMGELWLARQRGHGGLERRVVLKRALPGHAADPEFQDMFIREARIAASLDHPNVARVYDSGVTPQGRSFLAMEYVQGADLRELLRSHRGRPLPLHHAVTIGAALAAGLDYVHARDDLDGRHLGLVHRDVSPGNILLSYDGAIKITDFGVARADAESLATRSGAVKGKLAYMAPEQARGEDLDPRADLYALGVILFEMVIGHRPFGRTKDVALLYRLLEEDAPRAGVLRPDLPPPLAELIDRLLARDKDRRFDRASEVRDALEQLCASSGWVLSGPRLGRYVEERCGRSELPEPSRIASEGLDKVQSVVAQGPRTASRGPVWLGLAAAALVLLGGVGWATIRQAPADARTLLSSFPEIRSTPPVPDVAPEAGPPVVVAEPPAPPTTLQPKPAAVGEPNAPAPTRVKKPRRRKRKRSKKRDLDSPLPFGE